MNKSLGWIAATLLAGCYATSPPLCGSMDARGEGDCRALIGWAYDGRQCTELAGCNCVGDDCGSLYATEAACADAHRSCAPGGGRCDAQDVGYVGDCRVAARWHFDGTACIADSGCECRGADCDRTFETASECAAAYASCIADPCASQEARGDGDCRASVGWYWIGGACIELTGCRCVGADCAAGYDSAQSCEAARAQCIAPSPACGPMDARGEGECDANFGVAWDGEACVSIDGCACVGADCANVYRDLEACIAARTQCRGCAPQDAISTQRCANVIGYRFDGEACVEHQCNCVGRDCGSLFSTRAECEGAFAACIEPSPPSCAPMDARSDGLCDAFFGYAWDGTSCRALSGCSCEGAECAAAYESLEACERDHAECVAACRAIDPVRDFGPCDAVIGIVWDGSSCVLASGCGCRDLCSEVFEDRASCERANAGCATSPCSAQDARGVGECRQLIGVRWNGTDCEAISGCTCEGADCDALYDTVRACDREYTLRCDQA